MNIVAKLPTRNRPERFKEVITECIERQSGEVTYLISADKDDETMNNTDIKLFCLKNNLNIVYGKSKNKVHAINRDEIEFDILILLSDDMYCVQDGWDERIKNDMISNFPDMDGVLWYNDGFTGDKLDTMVIMGRKYYDRFGYIYHPEYTSLWCDNEFMEVAKSLERIIYFDDVLFEHRHPANIGYGNDEGYELTESFYKKDEVIFNERKSNGFA